MKDTKNTPKTVADAIDNQCVELGILVADGGAKVKIEGKDSVIASRPRHGRTKVAVPFVDTNIIPDRNAGIGSLLWDLQNPHDPHRDGPALLEREFAFIDVGVSRAKASTALKTLLVGDLRMAVDFVATELPEAVPYANVTLLGGRAEKIRRYLSRMSPSKETTYEVTDWHYVIDRQGKVSSVAYSYNLHENEVCEAYFMGRTFMYAGKTVEFSDPELDKMLAADVAEIEASIDLERQRDGDSSQPAPLWNGYRIKKNPLQAGLSKFGITLQTKDVPQRIEKKQNVLFVGNVLNHYPRNEQARELERIVANTEEGDLVIIQMDEVEDAFIDVLQVKRQGGLKTCERVRWIDTKKLEIQRLVPGSGSLRQIRLKPCLERMVGRLVECLGMNVSSQDWPHKDHKVLVHQSISYVFRTFFRALPVEETLRIAIREALRRLPTGGVPKGIRVFNDDAKDVYGGSLTLDASPIVSETDFVFMKMAAASVE